MSLIEAATLSARGLCAAVLLGLSVLVVKLGHVVAADTQPDLPDVDDHPAFEQPDLTGGFAEHHHDFAEWEMECSQ